MVEYLFQRLGTDPKTKKPYETKTISLPVKEATTILRQWEVKDQKLNKKRSNESSDKAGPLAQKPKVGPVTTYGPAFKRAVNTLFCEAHGREREEEYLDGYAGLILEDKVNACDLAILPLVKKIKKADREAAAGYAIRATLDLYSAYMFANAEEGDYVSYGEFYQQKDPIMDSLCETGDVGGGEVAEWEEAMYYDTRDGTVQDINRWKWRLYAVEGIIRRHSHRDAKRAAEDEAAGKDDEIDLDEAENEDGDEDED